MKQMLTYSLTGTGLWVLRVGPAPAFALQCLNPEPNPLSNGSVQLICWSLPFQSTEFGQIEEEVR